MRASRTRRGTLPGRNPGTRASRAILRTVWSSARSTSVSSTSTDSRTLLSSSDSVVARMAETHTIGATATVAPRPTGWLRT